MIVSVSIIFFVLEFPILIFICLMQGEWLSPDLPYFDLFWTVMNLMMYTNHVINFISYCMTGTKFRRELFRLIRIDSIIKLMPCKCIQTNAFATSSQKFHQKSIWNRKGLDNNTPLTAIGHTSFRSVFNKAKKNSKKPLNKGLPKLGEAITAEANKKMDDIIPMKDQNQIVTVYNQNETNTYEKSIRFNCQGEPFLVKV